MQNFVLVLIVFVAVFAAFLKHNVRASSIEPPSQTYTRTFLGDCTNAATGMADAFRQDRAKLLLAMRERARPFLTKFLFNSFSDISPLLLRLKSSPKSRYYSECLRDIETILVSSLMPGNKTWALKYVDSWGKPPAGILQGNFAWYGDFDECLAIEPVEITTEDEEDTMTRKITSQYCRVGLSPIDTRNKTRPDEGLIQLNKVLTIGICVSTACSAEALGYIFSELVPTKSGLYVDFSSTYCQLTNPPMSKHTFIAIGILSIIGLFMVIGFALDVHLRLCKWAASWRKSRSSSLATFTSFSINNESETGVISTSTSNNNGSSSTLDSGKHPNNLSSINLSLAQKVTRFFLCFSPYSNLTKLLKHPPNSKNIPNLGVFHSIRAISIFWVILGHSYLFLLPTYDNIFVLDDWEKRLGFQFVMSGFFGVDTFFFLSGFFAYYSLSRHFDLVKKRTPKSWFWKSLPSIYFHRYARITPPYLAIIMIDICLWRHLSNGPFYFQGIDAICQKNWWKNALYLNNFFAMADQCVAWGWYLAVDMQLFVILAPFLVAIFMYRPRLGWTAALLTILAHMVLTFWITYFYQLPSSVFQPQNKNQTIPTFDGQLSSATHFFETIYMKPYCRLGPYVVGIIFGHIVVKHSLYLTRSLFSRPVLLAPFWLLSFSTIFVLIYGQFGIISGRYVNPQYVDALYNSLARTGWAIALGWLVLALVLNRAGPIGRFLSWQCWAIPAKLSYAAYLVHPLVLIFFAHTARRPFHGTDVTMINVFLGNLVSTFIISIIFSLIFESPIVAIQRMIGKSSASL